MRKSIRAGNVGIIGDTHLPFTHEDYLEFVVETFKAHNVTEVIHIGDLVDNHALSYHEHDPSGRSAGDELAATKRLVKPWVKAFPKLRLCIGNHDALLHRQAKSNGIPADYLRSYNEVLGLPDTWEWDFSWVINGVKAKHGTNTSGKDAAYKSAMAERMPVAQGHLHGASGVLYHASDKDLIWGMQVGCGVDRRAYAFDYGKDHKDKPILSCGLILENGTVPMVVPMKL